MSNLTLVFTDVVGASKMKRDPSLGRDSIERDSAYLASVQVPHNNLIRQCCEEHGGQEVNTMGDAFYLIFPDAVQAVRCSISIQEQLSTNPIETPLGSLRLRIGIHTGAPQAFDDDWHGTDVDTAARVEAMATGGQILLSPTTYDLVRHMTDIRFQRMGEFMLKGIDRVILWEADWDGNGPRPTERSPVSLDLDLPPSLRGFIGRSMELAELESLLEKHSAVNLEGLSGIGKTSLALSLADRWLGSGRIAPNGLFYFDCSQRNMRLGVASEFLLRNLAAFFSQVGAGEVASIVSNEEQPLDRRYNAVSSTLMRGSYLVLLDNLQDALDENRRIASQPLADLLYFVLSRPLADSRFICASYVQCSWSSRLSIQPFRLKPLSTKDARELLLSLGVENLELADRAAQLVGRHPQAIRWFSVLPRELGLSVEEVINDLSDAIDHDATGTEFHRRIEDELLSRIWDTLPKEVGHFLSVSTVFRRPVPFSALCALTPSTEIDRWRKMLLDRFLLNAITREGPHTLHQIVREFALERIQSDSDEWQGAHLAAAKWWQGRAARAGYSTREGIEAAIEAHYHLISAGDMDEALSLAVQLSPILRAAGLQSYQQGLSEENLAINRALVQMAPEDPRAHLYLATTLSRSRKNFQNEAESHFQRSLELNPRFTAARIGYAQLLTKNGRIDDAEAQYRIGLGLNSKDAALRSTYALFLASLRQLDDEAVTQFQLALKTQPESVVALQNYARFLFHHGQFDEGERRLRAAIDIDPNNIPLRKAYIRYLFGKQRFNEGAAQLNALRNVPAYHYRIRKAYLKLLAKHATGEQADSEFTAALNVEPQNGYVRYLYTSYLIRNGRDEDAAEQFEGAINSDPARASIRSAYGLFLFRAGRLKEAEEQFKVAIDADPGKVSVRQSYVWFLVMRRRFDEAGTQLQAVVQLKPATKSLRRLAVFVESRKATLRMPLDDSDDQELMTLRRYDTLKMVLSVANRVASCKAILENNPDDFEENYFLGRTFMEHLKDAPNAAPCLLRATELEPNSQSAHFCYGQALEKLGRFDEALVELSKLTNASTKNPELHNSLANCLKQLGRLPEAEAGYRYAIRTSTRSKAKYLNNLALLFVAWPDTSRISEGLELCDQVAREYPSFPWTQKTRSELEGRKE